MPKVNIWIPQEELKKIDQFCKQKNRSRSNALRKALLYYIDNPKNNITT